MATRVTVKGQVTLPKKVRDAAGIKPGDWVEVHPRPGGGVVLERLARPEASEEYRRRVVGVAKQNLLANGPFRGMTTNEIMALLRGED